VARALEPAQAAGPVLGLAQEVVELEQSAAGPVLGLVELGWELGPAE
jgi:hypothetical protein